MRSSGLLRGNLHRSRPFPRNPLPGGELATARAHHRARQNDQTNKPNRPIKEILGLPLTPRFRQLLSQLENITPPPAWM
jgi:hypothetical protein